MFPMISAYFELKLAKRILEEAAESLQQDGLPFNRNIEIGIMIEVPSAVITADLMAGEVDFFSIGTNDLIQYALAIDRGNKQVAHLYQPLDPAILRMIKHVADVSRENGIKVFMCGEMAGTPHHIPILLGMGIDELSMNPQSIPVVKRIIRSIKLEDTRTFTKEALKQTTAKKVFELVRDTFGDTLTDHTYSGNFKLHQ
jgi:phosphotransferase system enzyme I (PtsI)